jgi:hydroxylaminobenzene mutase
MDPDPEPSTKARAVFALGLVAFLTGGLVGGVIPAVAALLLARQASRQAWQAGGYLTGSAWIRRGRRLAWAGILLALTALVVAAIAGLLHLAGRAGGTDFAPGTN